MSLNLTAHRFFFPENDPAAQWRIPLGLALGLHILAFTAVIIVPALMPRRTLLPTVYTVNLFTVEEAGRPSPAARPAPAKQSIVKPVAVKTPVSPSVPPASVTVAPLAKAISLEPLKTKTTKKEVIDVKKKLEEVKLTKALERLKTDIKVKEAEDKADQLKKDALESIRSTYQKNAPAAATATAEQAAATGTQTGSPGNTVDMNSTMRRYYAAAVGHIQEHWILPDLQNWDENLEAIVVVKIRRDGVVTKSFFESTSENVFFNQFVMKTLRDASPLPPFPADIEESSMEIGFRFHPTELF